MFFWRQLRHSSPDIDIAIKWVEGRGNWKPFVVVDDFCAIGWRSSLAPQMLRVRVCGELFCWKKKPAGRSLMVCDRSQLRSLYVKFSFHLGRIWYVMLSPSTVDTDTSSNHDMRRKSDSFNQQLVSSSSCFLLPTGQHDCFGYWFLWFQYKRKTPYLSLSDIEEVSGSSRDVSVWLRLRWSVLVNGELQTDRDRVLKFTGQKIDKLMKLLNRWFQAYLLPNQ